MVVQEGFLTYAYPENINTRTQDLETIYHDCGQFYFWKVDAYLNNTTGIWNTVPYIMPEEETQDCDNESDFRLAEMKYTMMLKRKQAKQ